MNANWRLCSGGAIAATARVLRDGRQRSEAQRPDVRSERRRLRECGSADGSRESHQRAGRRRKLGVDACLQERSHEGRRHAAGDGESF